MMDIWIAEKNFPILAIIQIKYKMSSSIMLQNGGMILQKILII